MGVQRYKGKYLVGSLYSKMDLVELGIGGRVLCKLILPVQRGSALQFFFVQPPLAVY